MKIQLALTYKLRFVLVGGILLSAQLSLAQDMVPQPSNINRKFQAKRLQEDFLTLRKVLEEAHAGLYRYTDKKTLDARFDSAFKRLNRNMTEREFFPIVASIVNAIKCGHTGTFPSSEYMSQLKMLPLKLRFINERAYVLTSPDNVITPGSELLSINGKKLSVITRIIFAHLSADGDNETSKYRRLNRRFSFDYNRFIGQPNSFDVEYYDAAERKKKKINLPHQIENAATLAVRVDDGKKPLRLEFLPNRDTALLTLRTFAEETIINAGQDWRKFLDAAFQEIKEKNIQNLIIDLRENSGGSDEFSSLLFSYLTDKEFRWFDYIETSTNKITLAQYTDIDDETNKMFAEDLLPAVANRFRVKPSDDFNLQQPQLPQKNHFDGKVWFLVSGTTFSSAADFCSIAHYYRRGSFVGEEVGGNYYGNTSGYVIRLTLPNTKIGVGVPLQKFINAVSGYAYPRRGVIPDYPVQQTIQDVLNGVDTEMRYTLKLITDDK